MLKFVYALAHRNQQNLGQNLLVSTEQKLPETVALLANTQKPLYITVLELGK